MAINFKRDLELMSSAARDDLETAKRINANVNKRADGVTVEMFLAEQLYLHRHKILAEQKEASNRDKDAFVRGLLAHLDTAGQQFLHNTRGSK